MGAVVDEFTSGLGFRVYFIQKEDVNCENETEKMENDLAK